MRSRIFTLFLSVLIFISSIQIVSFSKITDDPSQEDSLAASKAETVICNFKDIAYGSHKNQTFDLNLPVDDREEIGLVVFLHGGGWIEGDKSSVKKSLGIFASNKDYATASINYRLAGQDSADVYDIINDITAALTHIKAMSGGYGMNITKLVLCGHSAGGHLALLYSYKYNRISPITPVGAFVSASVPDLTQDDFYTKSSLGDEEYMCALISKVCGVTVTPENRASYKSLFDELSPVNFITPDSVPTVAIHGTGDRIAPYSGVELLNDVLTENRVMHEIISVPKGGHGILNGEKQKQYAEELMAACLKEWFDIKTTEDIN